MEKIKNYFSDWTKFEISWLIISSIVMISLSIIWGDTIIALISGLTGIIAVVLGAKVKLSNYAFATINVLLYAYLCLGNQLYGEFMLNAFYFIPMNLIGFLLWKKHKSADGDVEVRNLTIKGMVILTALTAISVYAYHLILISLGGNLALIDAVTTVVSVIALILGVTRYAEQWLLWIVVNVVSIVMWSMLLIQGDNSAITMLVMWTAYLFNSIYGYINWLKLSKKSQNTSEPVSL